MTVLRSYDLNGKKLSFANWISNLSPQETPFSSMTKKESINQTLFQWQTDALAKAGPNAQEEGATVTEGAMRSTNTLSNITQILRKTVKVSETADATANYGRGKELQYQMEKAGKELKRDIEWMFLNNESAQEESGNVGRKTAGFHALVAGFKAVDTDTGAVVHKNVSTNTLTEAAIWDMTYNLYLAGSRANIIMFHPSQATFFSGLQEKAPAAGEGGRARIFENTPKLDVYVTSICDPLGQEYRLIPNRWMPMNKIFFFNPDDWTQMILRAPERVKLAKNGSYDKWMIECEMGLRHRHPFASGILNIDQYAADHGESSAGTSPYWSATADDTQIAGASANKAGGNTPVTIAVGQSLKIKAKTGEITSGDTDQVIFALIKDGKEVWVSSPQTAASKVATLGETTVIAAVSKEDAGRYWIEVRPTSVGSAGGVAYANPYTSFATPISIGTSPAIQPAAEEAPVAKTRKPRAKKI